MIGVKKFCSASNFYESSSSSQVLVLKDSYGLNKQFSLSRYLFLERHDDIRQRGCYFIIALLILALPHSIEVS